MKAVLVLELRGLTQQAEVLVHELEHMSMNTERIRAATIDITKGAITRVSAAQHPEASGQQGTDTFYWTFPDVDSGAIFGSLLIADLWDKASRQGLYYVKPSLGLGWCEPQVSDSHLLDDGSLETYRVADGGRAFTLYLVADAIAKTAYPFLGPEEEARKAHVKVRPLDWQAAVASSTIDQSTVYIPPLLLDSDVVYSDTRRGAQRDPQSTRGFARDPRVRRTAVAQRRDVHPLRQRVHKANQRYRERQSARNYLLPSGQRLDL
jgi:hypothetical protein